MTTTASVPLTRRVWFTPLVLATLCLALLVGAMNRQDTMLYGMFWFLAGVGMLGWGWPRLSLAGTTMETTSLTQDTCIEEGSSVALGVTIHKRSPWPAFAVAVQTDWAWAGRALVMQDVLPVLRGRQATALVHRSAWPCRGAWVCQGLRLSSAFPLGLTEAHHSPTTLPRQLLVLPRPTPMQWPWGWRSSDDPRGERSTPRVGRSMELAHLRELLSGELAERVHWRASARAGRLMVQQFHRSGERRLWLLPGAPQGAERGDGRSAAEAAIRLAVGLAQDARTDGVTVMAVLTDQPPVVTDTPTDGTEVWRALATWADEYPPGLAARTARCAHEWRAGDQWAVTLGSHTRAEDALAWLAPLAPRMDEGLVALAPPAETADNSLQTLRAALTAAGWHVIPPEAGQP